MSLFKRGGVYWSQFYVDGKRYQESTGTSNRRQGEAIEQKRKLEVNAKRFELTQADPDMTFAVLATRFLTSGSTRPHHIYHLKFLLPFFGETAACKITKAQAAEFRKVRRLGNPKIKDATINRDIACIRHVLYWAIDEGYLRFNPLARIKLERERRIRRPVLSVEEELKLLPAASEHLVGMIIAALDAGLRRGEITGQRWEDIDLPRNILYVTRSKTPEGEAREIPLTSRLCELLSKQPKKSGIVFAYDGEPVRIIKRSWKTALRRAGLRHIRFHDLRHAFATRLMECGCMPDVRMALMGHSAGNSVHQAYIHVEVPAKREAILKLQAWVEKQKQLLGGTNGPKAS